MTFSQFKDYCSLFNGNNAWFRFRVVVIYFIEMFWWRYGLIILSFVFGFLVFFLGKVWFFLIAQKLCLVSTTIPLQVKALLFKYLNICLSNISKRQLDIIFMILELFVDVLLAFICYPFWFVMFGFELLKSVIFWPVEYIYQPWFLFTFGKLSEGEECCLLVLFSYIGVFLLYVAFFVFACFLEFMFQIGNRENDNRANIIDFETKMKRLHWDGCLDVLRPRPVRKIVGDGWH